MGWGGGGLCVITLGLHSCSILGEGYTLREHLIDDLDYFLLPEEGWDKLMCWYGLKDGQVSQVWSSLLC